MAELVADTVSFFSSMGSRRHGWLLLFPAWKTTPLLQAMGEDAIPSGTGSYLGQE